MKKKQFLYSLLCALGGALVGAFANQLNEIYGTILFTLGIGIMVYSIIKISK